MNKENKLTPEEITSVISEQPDLYEPTVQPLSERQNDGYYPIQVDSSEKEAITPSLAKLATPKSDRTWLERLKAGAKLAITNIMNEQLTHNVALGSKKITLGKTEEEVEYGRRMAAEAKRHIDEIMDDTEQLTPEEAESWATAIGSGSMSMVDFAANLALLRGLGAGSIGAQIGAGFLAGVSGYEEGALSDIEKYIAETGDKELKDYKGDKVGYVTNIASGTIQGTIESLTQGLGKFIFTNPLSKKVLGNWGEETGRKIVSTAVGRALAAGADESVSNAFEEWTQQLTGNIAEIVKGNKEFTVDNILQGAGQAAGVGALLGWMATPVMQEYGRRKTRDWVMDKLRKSADEKGIQVSDAEIKQAANDLVGVIESKGVQQVADNYEKINQITGSESDLAQKLAQVFQDLVKQGYVNFRNMTDDELRQAGLDWANWMQAQAILDSLDREVPLTASPLFNAVAELDRIYLEGRNAGEGDLLPLDINNAQVDYLATQIDDFINQNKETREAAEQARIAALRESDLKSRQDMIAELERNAQEELAKERAAQNEEAIRSLTATIVRLQAEMRATQEEVSKLLADRTTQGRISIKQARDILAPKNKELPNDKPKYPTKVGEKITFDKEGRTFEVERLNRGYKVTALVNGKPVANIQVNDNGTVQSVETLEKERRKGHGTALIKEAESIVGPMMVTIPEGDSGLEQFWWKNGYSQEIEPRTFVRNDVVLGKVENKADEPMYQEGTERLDDIYPEYEGDTILVDGVERTVYNSEGNRIAKSAESLTNFWRWFGNSVVVDKQGRPLVVYHGSPDLFDAFDTRSLTIRSPMGVEFGQQVNFGSHFATDKKDVDFYGYGKNIYSVYLSIENPYFIEDGMNSVQKTKEEGLKVMEDLIAQGYDGVAYYPSHHWIDSTQGEPIEHVDKDSLTYVAFEPTQIKDIDNLGYWGEEDDRLMYQPGFVSLKGEIQGEAIDADKFYLKGEGGDAWMYGNYFLASKKLDKEHYFDSFKHEGPEVTYDGQVLNTRVLSQLGINYSPIQSVLLNRLPNLAMSKEWFIKTFEDQIKEEEELIEMHYNMVKTLADVGDFTVQEIEDTIKDIEKIVLGAGSTVGPLFGFPQSTEEGKIQAKYLNDEKKKELFRRVYDALVNQFGGEDRLSSFGTIYSRRLADLHNAKKSLEAVKKLDFDKFGGRTGILYKGENFYDLLEKEFSNMIDDWRIKMDIEEAVRNALVHGKSVEKAINKLKQESRFDEEKVWADIDKLIAEKVGTDNKVLLSTIRGAFDAFLNSTDAGASMEGLMNGLGLTQEEKEIVNDIVTDLDAKKYLKVFNGHWYPAFSDLFFDIRGTKRLNRDLDKAKEWFKGMKNSDFVYKPAASMYKTNSIPENEYLLDLNKPIYKQSEYVKNALKKLFADTFMGFKPIVTNNVHLGEKLKDETVANKINTEGTFFSENEVNDFYRWGMIQFVDAWLMGGLDRAKTYVKEVADASNSEMEGAKRQAKRYADIKNENDQKMWEGRAARARVHRDVERYILKKVNKIPADAKVDDYAFYSETFSTKTGKELYNSLVQDFNLGSNRESSSYLKPEDVGAKGTRQAASKLLLKYGIKGGRYWGGRDKRGFVTIEPTPVDERIYQDSIYDGLLTTNSIPSVVHNLRRLPGGSNERMLYDSRNGNWYIANADDMVHRDMFIKAFEQGNYPEYSNSREADQFFQENYLAEDKALLQFLAQKSDRPADAKERMEHTLGTDEYTYAYLSDGLAIFARGEDDLEDSGFPTDKFDKYKVVYKDDNRKIVLDRKAKEDTNLIATHGISKEGIEEALKVGGLAMPSLAITKELGNNTYGPVLFVAPSSMAQPSRSTKVYDRDAWTPMVNFIEYTAKEGFVDRVKDILISSPEGYDKNSAYTFVANIEDGAGGYPEDNIMAKQLFAIYKEIPKDEVPFIQRKFDEDADLVKEYLTWYKDFIRPNLEGRIFKGFTPVRGTRKYVPATLDNIVKELKTQPERKDFSYADFYGFQDVMRESVTRFKNTKEIKKASKRIKNKYQVFSDAYDVQSDYIKLALELRTDENDHNPEYALSNAILDTEGTLAERLEKYGLKHDSESVKKVEDILERIKNVSVRYFEVKPRRAVRFNEFRAVFVPNSPDYDQIAMSLEEHLPVLRYRSDAERDEILRELTTGDKSVQFQNKKTSKSMTGLGKEHRGAYDPLTKAIIFNKVSDVTSLFHESAHYWFDRNLRYYKTGMASPDWKKRWEEVMDELGLQPNSKGQYTRQAVRAASEKFARSMEAYLKGGHYENAAIQWAHQDYANMVGRVYRSLWSQYWGLEDLSPAVKKWFDMFGYDVENPASAYKEEGQTIESDEEMVGAIVAEDQTQPETDPVVNAVAQAEGGQVVENIATGEVAVVPEDQFETEETSKSRLPKSAEKATGVKTEDIEYNRRSMSESMKAAQDLVEKDPVRAWEAIRSGEEMVDGLYAGDIYRALIAKYKAENNPTMIKTVVQTFANAARRAGRSVKAFDLETPTSTFEGAVRSIDKLFEKGSNKKKVDNLVKELKEFLHDPEALNKGWEKFKDEVGCK